MMLGKKPGAAATLGINDSSNSSKSTRSLQECSDVAHKLLVVAFCVGLLAANTLLAVESVLYTSSEELGRSQDVLLFGNVLLFLAPIPPCTALLLVEFMPWLAASWMWSVVAANLVGQLCWLVWILLSTQTWLLPAIVVFAHYIFTSPPFALIVSWLVTIVALLLALVMFYGAKEEKMRLAEDVVVSFVLLLGSAAAAAGARARGGNLATTTTAYGQHGGYGAPTTAPHFTLSLDDVNSAEAMEEIAAARRNKPGVWERVDHLKLSDVNAASLHINDQIGMGAFANIYRATLNNNGSSSLSSPPMVVALKRIKTVKREFVESTLNEVDILSECHHANIVQLLGWCDNPFVLVAFEYANGGSVHDFLLRSQLPVGWCAVKTKMAMDAASALAFLHNRGILHRDVKSENLLVFCNGHAITVKLGDFGCAMRHQPPQRSRRRQQQYNDGDGEDQPQPQYSTRSAATTVTGGGALVGSTLWHAPELLLLEGCNDDDDDNEYGNSGRAEGASSFSFATDVWAFGTTLCELVTHVAPWEDLLTGESLFHPNTSPAVQVRPIASQFANIHVYEHIVGLVERCCCVSPASDRPSINAVLFDLMQLYVAGDEPTTAAPPPPPSFGLGLGTATYAASGGGVSSGPSKGASASTSTGGGSSSSSLGVHFAAAAEENAVQYALSSTNVEISPQYSPALMDHKKRISDPTLSGQAFPARKHAVTRSAFATPVRPLAFISEQAPPPPPTSPSSLV